MCTHRPNVPIRHRSKLPTVPKLDEIVDVFAWTPGIAATH
jgi:hypothetical protein